MAKKTAPKSPEVKKPEAAQVHIPGVTFHKPQHPQRGIKFDLPKGE